MRKLGRVVAAAMVLAFVATTRVPSTDDRPAIELNRTAQASFSSDVGRGRVNILVIGSDVREGDPAAGRADSLHLVTLDTDAGTGTIIGIPRDSYVPIPGSGSNKINAALVFGGPERMVATVSQLAGMDIHYWALIDFSRFRDLVDAVGGIEVEVPYAMADPLSGAFFDPGVRHMNGVEALAFSRVRQGVPGGDFGRSENQGRLLLAAIHKFKRDTAEPWQAAKYLRVFTRYVRSNVPIADLLDLVRIGQHVDPSTVSNVVLPGSGGTAGGASVVFLAPGAHQIFDDVRGDGVL